jgi:hypothetical protein
MKYPTAKRLNSSLISMDIPNVLTPKNYYQMKSIKPIILFVLCLPILLFVLCLTTQQAVASEHVPNDGPVVKIEVKCNYVSLYTVKSDTAATSQRKIFPKGSLLSISGNDDNSMPKAIYVTINQTQEELYKEPIKLNAKGRHTVKIRAVDKDNKETTLTLTYLIVE